MTVHVSSKSSNSDPTFHVIAETFNQSGIFCIMQVVSWSPQCVLLLSFSAKSCLFYRLLFLFL